MIVWLGERTTPDLVGGKGAALCALAAAGIPVPDGFCVTADAMRTLDSQPRLQPLEDAVGGLGADAMAVRSSAVGEDSPAASFAGIHRSLLNVRSTPGVLEALREICASAVSDTAMAYRARRGIEGEPRIAAVVQEMIPSDVSGVLFTRDPLSGDSRFVAEASWGLGEAVVSGAVTPDHFVLTPEGEILEATISDKDVAFVPTPADGVATVEVSPERRTASTLDEKSLRSLAALGRACEDLFGAPQDVEWALEGGTFWILQSRPITR